MWRQRPPPSPFPGFTIHPGSRSRPNLEHKIRGSVPPVRTARKQHPDPSAQLHFFDQEFRDRAVLPSLYLVEQFHNLDQNTSVTRGDTSAFLNVERAIKSGSVVHSGYEIPPFYNSLVGELVVRRSRELASRRRAELFWEVRHGKLV